MFDLRLFWSAAFEDLKADFIVLFFNYSYKNRIFCGGCSWRAVAGSWKCPLHQARVGNSVFACIRGDQFIDSYQYFTRYRIDISQSMFNYNVL